MFLCTSKTFQRVTRLPFLPCNNLGIEIGIACAFPRSKTLVPVKTDYEAANIKVVNSISNRNWYSVQDVIKNYETIMSYNNVINPVYLIVTIPLFTLKGKNTIIREDPNNLFHKLVKKCSFHEIVLKEVISIIPSISKELYLVSMDIQNPLQIPI
ncbi:hypothetical protein ACTFIR_012842 [Dictyostelium discoideum]